MPNAKKNKIAKNSNQITNQDTKPFSSATTRSKINYKINYRAFQIAAKMTPN